MLRSKKILDGNDDNYMKYIQDSKKALFFSLEALRSKCKMKNENLYYENQEKTAEKVATIILKNLKVVFQLVIAMTQTGKTACMLAVIHQILIKSGCDMLLNSENIFIITGLSSTNWCEQTADRMPQTLQSRVYHRNNLKKLRKTLNSLGKHKRDILILMDEVHIASKDSMTLGVFLKELGFKDMNILRELNINFVQFSATPNQILKDLKKWDEYAEIHIMQPGKGYKGLKEMVSNNRLFQAKPLYIDKDPDENMNKKVKEKLIKKIQPAIDAIQEFKEKIESLFPNDFKYHITRIDKGVKTPVVLERFKKIFGGEYNFVSCYSNKLGSEILNIIQDKPNKHTVVFIKEHLRCAVTLKPKENVGILYERLSKRVQDDVIIQGLAGRATGYDVHDKMTVYSNIDSIKKYIEAYDSDFRDTAELTYHGSKSQNPKPSIVDPTTFKNSGKIKLIKEVKKNKDFEYRIFECDKKARKFCKEILKQKGTRICGKDAPKELKQSGKNPDLNYIIERKWGLNKKAKKRQVRLNTGKVCVYWRPSLLK